MNNIEGFDAHCHIFNLSYALREIKAMSKGNSEYALQECIEVSEYLIL